MDREAADKIVATMLEQIEGYISRKVRLSIPRALPMYRDTIEIMILGRAAGIVAARQDNLRAVYLMRLAAAEMNSELSVRRPELYEEEDE